LLITSIFAGKVRSVTLLVACLFTRYFAATRFILGFILVMATTSIALVLVTLALTRTHSLAYAALTLALTPTRTTHTRTHSAPILAHLHLLTITHSIINRDINLFLNTDNFPLSLSGRILGNMRNIPTTLSLPDLRAKPSCFLFR